MLQFSSFGSMTMIASRCRNGATGRRCRDGTAGTALQERRCRDGAAERGLVRSLSWVVRSSSRPDEPRGGGAVITAAPPDAPHPPGASCVASLRNSYTSRQRSPTDMFMDAARDAIGEFARKLSASPRPC